MPNRKRPGYFAGYVLFALSAVGVMPAFAPRCNAQTAADSPPVAVNKTARLRFEVASIRPAPDMATLMQGAGPGHPPHIGTKIDGSMVDIGSQSLTNLIAIAYSVPPNRVSGPGWMASQRFDVLAKLPAGATKEQLPELLQALLEERFMLALHKTSKLESAYALLVGPGGQRLETAITEDPQHGEAAKASPHSGFGGNSGPAETVSQNGPYGPQRVSISNGVMHSELYAVSVQGLAGILTVYLRDPVTDMTGLQGTYHVVLDFAQSELLPSVGNASALAAPPDPPFATLFAAISKLGLKLELRKVPVERFVIDHIEKMPTEN